MTYSHYRAHPPATTGDRSTTAPTWKGTSHILVLYLSAVFSLTKYNLALVFWTAGKNYAIVRSNILFLRLWDKHISPQVAAGNSRFVQILLDLVEMTPHFWQEGILASCKIVCMDIPLACRKKLPWFSSFASVTAWWPTHNILTESSSTAGSLWKCLSPVWVGQNFHQSHRATLHWLQ